MKKKYISPLFAELELEDVLYASGDDNSWDDDPFVDEDNDGKGDFDQEEDFGF